MSDNANQLKAYLDQNPFGGYNFDENREEVSEIVGKNADSLTAFELRAKVDSLSEAQVIRLFELVRLATPAEIIKEVNFDDFDVKDTL